MPVQTRSMTKAKSQNKFTLCASKLKAIDLINAYNAECKDDHDVLRCAANMIRDAEWCIATVGNHGLVKIDINEYINNCKKYKSVCLYYILTLGSPAFKANEAKNGRYNIIEKDEIINDLKTYMKCIDTYLEEAENMIKNGKKK